MRFRYLAYTLEQGIVRGHVEARGQTEAGVLVRHQGLKPLDIRPTWGLPALESLFPSLFGVSTGEVAQLSRQLATILASGGSLVKTLEVLQRECRNRVLRSTLESVRKTLDDGGSLSAALALHPKVFSPLFVSVVEVGEHTGRLGPALEQMAEVLEREREAKQKALRTLMYPMGIIGLSVATMGVLMTVALPPLLKVFNTMGARVPLMTRMAVGMVSGLKANFLEILLVVVAVAFGLWLVRRIPKVRYWMDRGQIKTPLVGGFTVAGELSRFSRTASMLLEAGVPLATALRLGTNGCKNLALRRAFLDAEESLVSGHGLTEALRRHNVLPTMFVQLVMIGEESNSLRRTMSEAAHAYQEQFDNRLNSLLALLEPASTLVVAAIVGFIAFSMFVPIYSGLEALK